MKGALSLGSLIAALVGVADGFAMLMPGPSNALGGAVILVLGLVWLLAGLPRIGWPEPPPSTYAATARIGSALVPLLYIPVWAVWWLATPEALTVWFHVAWLSLWLACLAVFFAARARSAAAED